MSIQYIIFNNGLLIVLPSPTILSRHLSQKCHWRWLLYSFLFLIIEPTRCTNFSNLFWNETPHFSGQLLCPSSGVFHCTHSNGICHTGLQKACKQDLNGTAVPSWSCLQAVCNPIWRVPLLCVHWKTPDDGQRTCPKHVEFHSKINLRN